MENANALIGQSKSSPTRGRPEELTRRTDEAVSYFNLQVAAPARTRAVSPVTLSFEDDAPN